MSLLNDTLQAIQPVSAEALAAAEERQNQLTKPPGSLGHLETVGNRLAAIAGVCPPPIPERPGIGLFAGDHGVCAQGVTPWPQEVTVQMMMNIAAGGAAINALARQAGATVQVTNVGVANDAPEDPRIRMHRVRRGTADFTQGPAMEREEALWAVEVGIATAVEFIDDGHQILLTGEMGIGNTTPSSALISVFTGAGPAEVTGRGAGADDAMLNRKVEVIEQGIALHQPDAGDPLGVLAAVGGLEQAALAGFILGAASRRVPVILDGVIACSAACAAVAFNEDVRGYLISGHAGAEPGIQAAVAHLGLHPLVDLGLRLGEGSGAALAVPMVQAAARILNEMATFASAGVSEG
ncbi:MAG: nicotinate-nucleotide--dimethylbenzimidazole phosphoribosyltransferase [Propionibacteriaceae bacterium]|nr:nicotinate-nucleotide--dimethylbenzimidazole phosphoribosyltransferase [Propionibacteriaceae bacterium]